MFRLYRLSVFVALCALLFGPSARARAKFEPTSGCYIGAFIERDFTFLDQPTPQKISGFEELTAKKHASYFTYVGYGRPFPMEWVQAVKGRGSAPQIAWEPNDGLEMVKDDFYLRSWARDAARAKVPIFLRWASEMNGPWMVYGKNPALYREKFRLVARVMREEAPNVAMVWTPFAEPKRTIASFYPGDEWVDWVGVNIYSVYVHNGDVRRPSHEEDPVEFLRYIYDTYSPRKPIHISEWAATIECKGTGKQTVDFAIDKMTRLYTALRRQFPRVKAVNWFVLNTIRSKQANNNYSFLEDGRALNAYRNLVGDSYFLTRVAYNPTTFRKNIPGGTTLGTAVRQRDLDDLVNASGAVAATIDTPFLRGIESNDVLRDDVNVRAQLPLNMVPSGLIWQVDGRTVALTNAAPYKVSIPRERIGQGKHTMRVIVLTRDGRELSSPEVPFSVAPFEIKG